MQHGETRQGQGQQNQGNQDTAYRLLCRGLGGAACRGRRRARALGTRGLDAEFNVAVQAVVFVAAALVRITRTRLAALRYVKLVCRRVVGAPTLLVLYNGKCIAVGAFIMTGTVRLVDVGHCVHVSKLREVAWVGQGVADQRRSRSLCSGLSSTSGSGRGRAARSLTREPAAGVASCPHRLWYETTCCLDPDLEAPSRKQMPTEGPEFNQSRCSLHRLFVPSTATARRDDQRADAQKTSVSDVEGWESVELGLPRAAWAHIHELNVGQGQQTCGVTVLQANNQRLSDLSFLSLSLYTGRKRAKKRRQRARLAGPSQRTKQTPASTTHTACFAAVG